MPKPRTTLIYQYDELSDEAKKKARDWYRRGNCDDTYWSKYVIHDAATVAGFLGLDINQTAYKTMGGETKYKPTVYFSGFWSQGDGACVEGTWRASDVKVDELKEYAPQDKELHRIGEQLGELAVKYPDGYFLVKHRGHYSHSGCTSFDVELPNDQEEALEYDSPEYKALQVELGEDEESLIELARDYMNWIYKRLEADWEWQNADEQVDENIRANEYEFLENGERA